MNSALAIAHQEGNNKSVEILLYYISKKKKLDNKQIYMEHQANFKL